VRLDLRIGELVVDGLPADRGRLGVTVERELQRLASDRGLPPGLLERGTTPHIDAGTIASGGDRLGPELARAIWEALQR
jgi:hypothetical protein